MDPASGSIPFASAAAAQQVARRAASSAALASYGATGVGSRQVAPLGRIGPMASISPVRAPDRVETAPAAVTIPARPTAETDRLVGARVGRGIDFEVADRVDRMITNASRGPEQGSLASGFPMYRHPADRHAAATGVDVGRSIDVTG